MPIATPPPITGAPSPAPQRSDRNTFSDRVDLFVTWLIAAVAQFGAVASNVFDNATSAFNSATNADASAQAAAQSSNATIWTTGASYAIGDVRFSPINFKSYRRKTAGAGSVDPSLDSTNWTTDVDFKNVESINGGQIAGFRNRVINGNCLVAQYGSKAIANNQKVSYGGCDRIGVAVGFATSASGTVAQVASAAFSSAAAQGLSLAATGAGTVSFVTRHEYRDVIDLNGKKITISAKLYHNFGTTLGATISVSKANVTDNFSASTAIASSGSTAIANNAVTPISFTLTLNSADANNGLQLAFNFNSVGSTAGASFYVGDIQLELGSVVSIPERLPYSTQLAMCRRYLRPWSGYVSGQAFSASMGSVYMQLDTAMRTSPTLSSLVGFNAITANGGSVAATPTVISSTDGGSSIKVDFTVATGLVAGNTTSLLPPAGILLSAEL